MKNHNSCQEIDFSYDISVIIPTYNRQDLIIRALDSVVNQTIEKTIEVLVIDDGSTDNTADLVKEYSQNAKMDIRLLVQDNQGVSAARNVGIQAAKGEWIALLDSDDEWLTIKLEKQFIELKKTGLKVIHSHEIWLDNQQFRNQKKRHKKSGGRLFQPSLALCLISPSAVVLHRSIFDDIGFFDEALPVCEDYDLWLRMTSKYDVAYVEEPMITKYAGHEGQLSKRYWGMDKYRIQSLEKNLEILKQLTNDDKIAMLKMLLKKIHIYSNGLKKRNKLEEWSCYHEKHEIYSLQLQHLLQS